MSSSISHASQYERSKEWDSYTCLQFLMLHELYSNHWLQISKLIRTKTEHDIKNHFYSLLRKCIAKIESLNFIFEGHLEIIQCYYIAHHIMDFFTRTHSSKKEYLNTLITLRKMTLEQCCEYFSQLCILYPYIRKVGWKAYANEVINTSPMAIMGFYFPNRILPVCAKHYSQDALPQEEKNEFMISWKESLALSMKKCINYI